MYKNVIYLHSKTTCRVKVVMNRHWYFIFDYSLRCSSDLCRVNNLANNRHYSSVIILVFGAQFLRLKYDLCIDNCSGNWHCFVLLISNFNQNFDNLILCVQACFYLTLSSHNFNADKKKNIWTNIKLFLQPSREFT